MDEIQNLSWWYWQILNSLSHYCDSYDPLTPIWPFCAAKCNAVFACRSIALMLIFLALISLEAISVKTQCMLTIAQPHLWLKSRRIKLKASLTPHGVVTVCEQWAYQSIHFVRPGVRQCSCDCFHGWPWHHLEAKKIHLLIQICNWFWFRSNGIIVLPKSRSSMIPTRPFWLAIRRAEFPWTSSALTSAPS